MVQRGEGYVTLKVVEKITQAIRESSTETRNQIKAMTISQEIALVESQLSSLRGQNRAMERKKKSRSDKKQLAHMYFQEYQLLCQLREKRREQTIVSGKDLDNDSRTLQFEIDITSQQIQALNLAGNKKYKKEIAHLKNQSYALPAKYSRCVTKETINDLQTYQLPLEQEATPGQINKWINIIDADIYTIGMKKRTHEFQIVLDDLAKKKKGLFGS